jgi:hypothetical protein
MCVKFLGVTKRFGGTTALSDSVMILGSRLSTG